MLVRQSEAPRDPPVVTEELADKIRAVAHLAAMQQHNMVRQSAGAIEDFANSGQGLEVGKVAVAAMIRRFRNGRRSLSTCILGS